MRRALAKNKEINILSEGREQNEASEDGAEKKKLLKSMRLYTHLQYNVNKEYIQYTTALVEEENKRKRKREVMWGERKNFSA